MDTLLDRLQVCLAHPTLATIGVFDGVHLGHQHLVREMRQKAAALGCLAGVITIHPHPRQVMGNTDFIPSYLMTLDERLRRLRLLEVDWLAQLRFDISLGQISAMAFLTALRGCLNFVELWAGPDFALGHRREGNLSLLRTLGDELNFVVQVAPMLTVEGQPVSSTRIRQLLVDGDVQPAGELMGTPFVLPGTVVAGFQRGRALGFPTANLEPDDGLLVPGNGVYAAYARWQGARYPAIVNIGKRPTFDDGPRSIEAYILDLDADLYGQRLELEFIRRLRGEMRFSQPAQLVAQIEQDVRQARFILSS
jgi:riboflavin kinase / FMN adenylyltransferase